MEKTITNLTDSSRNDNPQDGDKLRITYDNGAVLEQTYYSPPVVPEATIKANNERIWRNLELSKTDKIVPLTDYPNHTAWITYRQQLRDWPDTDNFPDTKPTI